MNGSRSYRFQMLTALLLSIWGLVMAVFMPALRNFSAISV